MMLVGSPGNWGKPMRVSPEKGVWAGVLALDDTSVLAMWEDGGCKTRKITLT
jgi:hypothetical protein